MPESEVDQEIHTQPCPRCVVYIDGFNLYKGSIRGTAHKWLDLQKYFERLRQAENVTSVKYFTAPMLGKPGKRQETYLRALETLPKVELILGRHKKKNITCRVSQCSSSGSRMFSTLEEKRTDVNIALQILEDAFTDVCDVFVIVSGDSDLVPAIHKVKQRFPKKKIVVYIPARTQQRGAAVEMRAAADKHKTLPMNLLSKCHLPSKIPDGSGGFIEKPAGW